MSVTELFETNDVVDDADLQVTADGRLRHLLTLRGLDRQQITDLLDRAETFLTPPGQPAARSQALRGVTVANLFFEPSTRTRASFELVAKRLGADVLNLDVNTSSRKKGESILDTIYTLQAMQVDIFVVRDAAAGVPGYIARNVNDYVSILNAGEADLSHPTQGLLDLLTIRRHKKKFSDLTVAIVGDIAHSRVARSASEGLMTMGLHDLSKGMRGADVVMALRIQRERIDSLDEIPGMDEYFANFGVSHERMKLAAPDAIVMHPGPMNRGIEIESSLADGPSSVIVEQVTNGVAVRMALLETVVETMEKK
jgi:aspartate carbamoyltransferase catalytic subunit